MGALLPISKWENQVQPMKENRENLRGMSVVRMSPSSKGEAMQ